MNRRGFLKGLATAIVAAPVAVKALSQEPKPEPDVWDQLREMPDEMRQRVFEQAGIATRQPLIDPEDYGEIYDPLYKRPRREVRKGLAEAYAEYMTANPYGSKTITFRKMEGFERYGGPDFLLNGLPVYMTKEPV